MANTIYLHSDEIMKASHRKSCLICETAFVFLNLVIYFSNVKVEMGKAV